jgi:hypothetical protein
MGIGLQFWVQKFDELKSIVEFEFYNKKSKSQMGKLEIYVDTWDDGLQLEFQTWKPYTLNLTNTKIQENL